MDLEFRIFFAGWFVRMRGDRVALTIIRAGADRLFLLSSLSVLPLLTHHALLELNPSPRHCFLPRLEGHDFREIRAPDVLE